jgi:hypothetical protein
MRVLLDNGIEGHSQFADSRTVATQVEWNATIYPIQIAGFVLKRWILILTTKPKSMRYSLLGD